MCTALLKYTHDRDGSSHCTNKASKNHRHPHVPALQTQSDEEVTGTPAQDEDEAEDEEGGGAQEEGCERAKGAPLAPAPKSGVPKKGGGGAPCPQKPQQKGKGKKGKGKKGGEDDIDALLKQLSMADTAKVICIDT